MTNPYQPPKTNEPAPPLAPSHQKLAPGPGVCPKCRINDFTELKFTWWGGAVGPRLLNHVKCNGCGATFNKKTGKPNTVGIVIYSVVITGILVGILIALR
ncbi:MAG: hypothetical protein CSA24_00780 [Deltaproteobacteria bacterium]|nr:MAG: hypothetical protein CSB49_00940 [Pseudomonadota bacterium]PIE66194.1 MAG: hypothetical protein CSA24_00780 [Deltaproteobacteria bacterium]